MLCVSSFENRTISQKEKDVKIDFHFVIVAGIFCPTSNIHKIFSPSQRYLQPKSLHTKGKLFHCSRGEEREILACICSRRDFVKWKTLANRCENNFPSQHGKTFRSALAEKFSRCSTWIRLRLDECSEHSRAYAPFLRSSLNLLLRCSRFSDIAEHNTRVSIAIFSHRCLSRRKLTKIMKKLCSYIVNSIDAKV